MAVRSASATLSAGARIRGELRPTGRGAGVVHAATQLKATMRRDRRAAAGIPAAVEVTASAERLPQSQHVFLTFHLDRTSVPYLAERG